VKIRRSNILADDEGTVFVTRVPHSPIQVMGRRDSSHLRALRGRGLRDVA
jgi:hypothetical protein